MMKYCERPSDSVYAEQPVRSDCLNAIVSLAFGGGIVENILLEDENRREERIILSDQIDKEGGK